jgi:outer membrane protein assembly factor BamD (BamD/ComL family)
LILRAEKIVTFLALIFFTAGICSTVLAQDDGWEWTKSAGWSRSEGTAKGTPGEQYQYAKSLQEKGNFYDAARQYFLLVRTFPNSREASRAILSLAQCLFEMENYYASFKALEQSIEKYPKSIHLPALLELEFRIGKRFSQGAPPSLFNSKDPKRDALLMSIEVFKAVIKHDEYGPLADDCYSELGMAYLELNKPQTAKDKLSILLSSFPESELIALARYRIALANIQLGQGTLAEAKKRLKELQMEVEQRKGKGAPVTQEKLKEDMGNLREDEARRMYEAAVFYVKRGSPKSYDAALFSLKEIVRRYPETSTAEFAGKLIEELVNKGRPKKGIGERNFNLPNLPLPRVSKIPVANKLVFWSKEDKAKEAAQNKGNEPAVNPTMGYSGVSVKPVNKLYEVGNVTVDLAVEESRLSSIKRQPQGVSEKPLEAGAGMRNIEKARRGYVESEKMSVAGKPIGAAIDEDSVLVEIPGKVKDQKMVENEKQAAGEVPSVKEMPLSETEKRLAEYEIEAQRELKKYEDAKEKVPAADSEDTQDKGVAAGIVEKDLNIKKETPVVSKETEVIEKSKSSAGGTGWNLSKEFED